MANREDMIIARLDRMEQKIDLCIVDIAGLKIKATVWGLMGGMVPVVVGMGTWIISVAV